MTNNSSNNINKKTLEKKDYIDDEVEIELPKLKSKDTNKVIKENDADLLPRRKEQKINTADGKDDSKSRVEVKKTSVNKNLNLRSSSDKRKTLNKSNDNSALKQEDYSIKTNVSSSKNNSQSHKSEKDIRVVETKRTGVNNRIENVKEKKESLKSNAKNITDTSLNKKVKTSLNSTDHIKNDIPEKDKIQVKKGRGLDVSIIETSYVVSDNKTATNLKTEKDKISENKSSLLPQSSDEIKSKPISRVEKYKDLNNDLELEFNNDDYDEKEDRLTGEDVTKILQILNEETELESQKEEIISKSEIENKNKVKNKRKKKKTKLKPWVSKLIITIIILVCLVTVVRFSISLFKLNIIPTKYLISGYLVISVILLILSLLSILNKHIVVKVICAIFICAFSFLFSFATPYINDTYSFLDDIKEVERADVKVNVIVLKDSKYKKIEDLKGKNIAYLNDDYSDEIINKFSETISFEKNAVDDIDDIVSLLRLLLKKETDAVIYEDSHLEFIKEILEDFNDRLSIIYSFQVNVEIKNAIDNFNRPDSNLGGNNGDNPDNNSEDPNNNADNPGNNSSENPNNNEKPTDNKVDTKPENIYDEPFIIYLSGVDKFSTNNSYRAGSDVNQLVVVNPKTYKILLLNTPRDFYVPIGGGNGFKNKLTAAGYYGVGKSVSTLESLYNIKINYYVRLYFDCFSGLVDAIGGVDIYSDISFQSQAFPDIYIKQGMNHFNGLEALAYARERKAYNTGDVRGDNRRGMNQQQLITAIINKISKSTTLINNYSKILNSLKGKFQTNMTSNEITSMIKYQLDKMPKWSIETYTVTGEEMEKDIYLIGTMMYITVPNMNSINAAKNKITSIVNEK